MGWAVQDLRQRPVLCSVASIMSASAVHGIFLARTLEWIAMPSSRESSQLRHRAHISYVSCIGSQILFTTIPPRKPSKGLGRSKSQVASSSIPWMTGSTLLNWIPVFRNAERADVFSQVGLAEDLQGSSVHPLSKHGSEGLGHAQGHPDAPSYSLFPIADEAVTGTPGGLGCMFGHQSHSHTLLAKMPGLGGGGGLTSH